MEGSMAGAGEGGSSLLFDMPDHLASNFEEIRRIKSQASSSSTLINPTSVAFTSPKGDTLLGTATTHRQLLVALAAKNVLECRRVMERMEEEVRRMEERAEGDGLGSG